MRGDVDLDWEWYRDVKSLRKVENIGISEKGKYRNIKNLPPSKHAYFDCTKNPHYFITEPSKEKKI